LTNLEVGQLIVEVLHIDIKLINNIFVESDPNNRFVFNERCCY
jgi:hypothetical protein